MSINKVILVGHIGHPLKNHSKEGGVSICAASLATSNRWKDKNSGEFIEETEWHNLTFFGKTAEIALKYLDKGSNVYIEGRLKTDKYIDKHGVERYTTKVNVDNLQMLGRKSEKADKDYSGYTDSPKPQPHPKRDAAAYPIPDDDIPF